MVAVFARIICLLSLVLSIGCSNDTNKPLIDEQKLATNYYQEDAQWYLDNIPFFECSDKELEQVYYYRWKMYKAHIRNVGPNEFVITEFINHVGWDRDPFCTINAATMHHIYEGRWLRDDRYMDGYINNMYHHSGNNRHYSESIADASFARYLVNADSAFILSQLDSMQQMYDQWSDHWDAAKNLYFIPAMPDATEYTIASIDASGGKDGFEGGEAFRPTINSYMYGNALAISKIAAMQNDTTTSRKYSERAASLKSTVLRDLWNDSLQHFTDRFKVNNQFVHYWDFIRGRELAGFAPWYFNLPDTGRDYNVAWKHLTDTTELLGKFGLRTNEPSYQYYFKQYVFTFGKPGSQWNGPSWPYQTSQMITAMANLLNNYQQSAVTPSDYLKILRQFAMQHYLPDGKLDLVENYDPNNGGPIVYFYWSNHYNHSSFNNLIISGLCGIRPSSGDTLDIHPLIDTSIKYFCLKDVAYHGHKLALVYDRDGSKYEIGKGLSAFVDGKKVEGMMEGDKYRIVVGAPVKIKTTTRTANFALNIMNKGYPTPSASVNNIPDSLYQAVDGRIWYFPEISNRWTTAGSNAASDWFAIDFGQKRDLSEIKIYPFADHQVFGVPDSVAVEYENGGNWMPVKRNAPEADQLVGNTANRLAFDKINTAKLRITFRHSKKDVAISEIECY